MAQAFNSFFKAFAPIFRPAFNVLKRGNGYLEWAFPENGHKAAFAIGTTALFVGINKTKNNWYPEKPFFPIKPSPPLEAPGPDAKYPFIVPTADTLDMWLADPDQLEIFLEWAEDHPDNLDNFLKEQFDATPAEE